MPDCSATLVYKSQYATAHFYVALLGMAEHMKTNAGLMYPCSMWPGQTKGAHFLLTASSDSDSFTMDLFVEG